jgi:hypothetical protein
MKNIISRRSLIDYALAVVLSLALGAIIASWQCSGPNREPRYVGMDSDGAKYYIGGQP